MPKLEKKIEVLTETVTQVWTAPSSTDLGTKHYTMSVVDASGEISFICSCKGFQYAGLCWHTEQAKEW